MNTQPPTPPDQGARFVGNLGAGILVAGVLSATAWLVFG